MKNLDVFSHKTFFFVLIRLRITRQDISSYIYFALAIIKSKIVARQLLCPLNLTKFEGIYDHELIKIDIIDQNKDFMFAAFFVMPPILESFNNGKNLNVVSFVSSFCKNHFCGKIFNQIPLA